MSGEATKKKCAPCESLDKSSLLGFEELEEKVNSSLPLWKIITKQKTLSDDNSAYMISRSFTAKNFQAALDCINAMGAIAEREGHHPDFHLTSYRNVEIVLFTHKVQGVTENDLALARMFDEEVEIEYSPKWFRENIAPKQQQKKNEQ